MLQTIKHISEHGLEKTIEEFKLISRRHLRHPNLVLLRYNTLESPMEHPIPQECRAIILDESDGWKPVSFPYTKFFNHGEGHAPELDWKTARVYEKLDGCCHEEVTIITEDGPKSIKEICETKFSENVLCFDHDTQQLVWDKIIGHSIKPNVNDWYELELEDGTTIKLTATHKVWVVNLMCYRLVSELKEGDEFLKI